MFGKYFTNFLILVMYVNNTQWNQSANFKYQFYSHIDFIMENSVIVH